MPFSGELGQAFGQNYMSDLSEVNLDNLSHPNHAEKLERERMIGDLYYLSPFQRGLLGTVDIPVKPGQQFTFKDQKYAPDPRTGIVHFERADAKALMQEHFVEMTTVVAVQEGWPVEEIREVWKKQGIVVGDSIVALTGRGVRKLVHEKPIQEAIFLNPDDIDENTGTVKTIEVGFVTSDKKPIPLRKAIGTINKVAHDFIPQEEDSIREKPFIIHEMLASYPHVETPTSIRFNLENGLTTH